MYNLEFRCTYVGTFLWILLNWKFNKKNIQDYLYKKFSTTIPIPYLSLTYEQKENITTAVVRKCTYYSSTPPAGITIFAYWTQFILTGTVESRLCDTIAVPTIPMCICRENYISQASNKQLDTTDFRRNIPGYSQDISLVRKECFYRSLWTKTNIFTCLPPVAI